MLARRTPSRDFAIGPDCGMVLGSNPNLSQGAVMSIPVALEGVFQSLPSDTQALVLRDYEHRKKSGLAAYILWFLLGFHYLYLGRIGIQLLYWLTAGGLGLWILIDIFRIPGMVERKNEDIARELMAQYQAIRAR